MVKNVGFFLCFLFGFSFDLNVLRIFFVGARREMSQLKEREHLLVLGYNATFLVLFYVFQ